MLTNPRARKPVKMRLEPDGMFTLDSFPSLLTPARRRAPDKQIHSRINLRTVNIGANVKTTPKQSRVVENFDTLPFFQSPVPDLNPT